MTTTATRAHLLIQADPGTAAQLHDYLSTVPGIERADCTSGPFDAVALVVVPDEQQLERVLNATRRAPGLVRLRLCRTSPTAA